MAPPPAAQETSPEPPSGNALKLFPDLKRRTHLVGIVVPDDFVLPPGYVRHYQTAHGPDGVQALPPILLYDDVSPPQDATGAPLTMPPDRVVPSDRAPPGLPVKMLEIPPSEYEGD